MIPHQWIHNINSALSYLHTGRWMRERGFGDAPKWESRFENYTAIIKEIADTPITFLEFGVFQGESLRWWSEHLENPATRLYGFDSFEGLPED